MSSEVPKITIPSDGVQGASTLNIVTPMLVLLFLPYILKPFIDQMMERFGILEIPESPSLYARRAVSCGTL